MNPRQHDRFIAVEVQINGVELLTVLALADNAAFEQVFKGKSNEFQGDFVRLDE